MKITYDNSLKIAGIGLVPWTRLGPDIWFKNYKIASMYGWDIELDNVPEVFALTEQHPNLELAKLNSQSMLNNPQFQQMLIDNFNGYSFLTYKPITVPVALKNAGLRFLATDTALASKIENKAYFRTQFAPLGIPFPAYKIYEKHEISTSLAFLKKILAGRSAVIVQDSELSGGKGTYVVRDMDTLRYALDSIQSIGASGTIVVSEKIEDAHERTVQCVVTRHGIFVGPLQKQVIADPLLANLNVADGDKFCGAEISHTDEFADAYTAIKKYAEAIGKELQTLGYKGIFGVDCLVTKAGDVYVLEVNPRITGVTPLLTMLYREDKDIPFYLLHVLELMDVEYQITDTSVDDTGPEGSLLMLHSHANKTSHIVESPQSGIYDKDLTYVEPEIRFNDSDDTQVLVQQYTPASLKVKPGGRVLSVFVNGSVLDDTDGLSAESKKLVSGLLDMVKLEQL